MAKRPKTLKAVRPNVGVEAQYYRSLSRLLDEMDRSLLYWIKAKYRTNEERIAQDANPADILQKLMSILTARWLTKFNEVSRKMAERAVYEASQHSETALKKSLRDAGVAIKFKPTERVKMAMTAAVNENVLLIKGLGERHLNEINQMVMRAVVQGGSLGDLTKGLQERFGMTRRRAAFIARDQNSKITSVINRERQIETGLTEAEWVHSAGGKHPRASHVKAGHDRLRFDVRKGAYLDGEWIQPGEAPNCRCFFKTILPGWND